MYNFALKEIEEIKGKLKIFKLLVNGTCAFDEFEHEIDNEGSLASELRTIAARLYDIADCKSLPDTKFTGSSRLVRLHGGFVTEAELNRVTAFLKKQAKPVYDESVLKEPEEERAGYDGGERDTMFLDAVRMVLQEGQCSITLIQRRLRLGYARAARIVDMMEQDGIIGPADGSKPREILVAKDYYETVDTWPR